VILSNTVPSYLGYFNSTTQDDIPGDPCPQNQCCDNLKSWTEIKISVEKEQSFKEQLRMKLSIHGQNFAHMQCECMHTYIFTHIRQNVSKPIN